MKKLFFAFVAVVALGLTSCKDCVDCSGVSGADETGKICKDDYDKSGAGTFLSWDDYKSLLKSAGCK